MTRLFNGEDRSAEDGNSSAISDPALQPFLQQEFDPVSYLNNALPTLFVSSGSGRITTANAVSLPELNAQTQKLLTQLSSQTARLSNTLTQLTDEIIRSGGRLAYEVELLRGEAIGLSETLGDGLKNELAVFMPQERTSEAQKDAEGSDAVEVSEGITGKPEFVSRLHTLTTTRERLDGVIKIFDEAMRWPLAPSDISSASSSIIAVSAPTDDATARDLENKAKLYIESLQRGLEELLETPQAIGAPTAADKLARLHAVADVWKSTAEEKARQKIIDDLDSFVEEREKNSTDPTKAGAAPGKAADFRYGNSDSQPPVEGRYGFLQNLRSIS